jgi:uncharacterized membrane protein
VAFGSIVIAGVWLRFYNLEVESLWLDEAASWQQSKDSLTDLITRTAQDNNPPLHNLFLYLSMRFFGDGEWSLRLPSAIFGTTNILAIYWLGSMTGGRIAGLLAAIFLAFSGFHVWYSQEARMYALFALTTTLFAACSVYFVKSPAIARGALVSIAGAMLLYSHPFGTLNWIAIVIASTLFSLRTLTDSGRTITIWFVSNAVAAAAFAPWAWVLWRRAVAINQSGFWIEDPSTQKVLNMLIQLMGGRHVAALLFIGVILALLPRRDVVDEEGPLAGGRSPIYFFLLWAGLPIALAAAISLLSTPILVARYLIGSLPALILAGTNGLSRVSRGWLGFAVVAVLSIVILARNYVHYMNTRDPREDWRGVSVLLQGKLSPSDCVLVYPPYVEMPLSYYYRNELPCRVLPDTPTNIAGDHLFVVFSHTSKRERAEILSALSSDRWLLRQEYLFQGVEVIELSKPGS